MPKRYLLDCTLRDGGYINDWEFGHETIIEIFERLVSAKVDFIEIGFLDGRRKFDINRTIMPDTASANKIFSGLDKGQSIIVAMIDYGTCDIRNLQPASETFIDGIRVIFKEHLMYEAMEYIRQVKALGYKVFAQMVSVTTYTDVKLKEYANLVNKVKPFATSMVDTYGLLHPDQLLHIFSLLDEYLDKDICVGYHAHNNFQMGYANGISFLKSKTKRNILVDGTLYGMGKSAGNATTELLAMHMNELYGGKYDITQILEIIDNTILDIYRKQYWGYNLFFYIAASTKCHPNYVSFLMNKKTLSVSQIIDILNSLEFSKKLMYDAKYAEHVYVNYQNIVCDDRQALTELKKKLHGEKILLLGPGRNFQREKGKIKKYIAENAPIVIAVNYVPNNVDLDYIFLTNAKRYTQVKKDLQENDIHAEIIATSNVTKITDDFKYVVNYGELIDLNTEIVDNSLVMLLKLLIKLSIREAILAGFDGYSSKADNYFDVSREYSYVKEKSRYLNEYVSKFLLQNCQKLNVEFLTQSHYEFGK
ncbi:MAG: aldolase catalytic domain-containing protein [Phascolarctobacterium sp.]|nr:aldolase catalytic domain-containing protein [Phascolarctobacterium sp.]